MFEVRFDLLQNEIIILRGDQSFRVPPEVEVHQSYHFWFSIDVVVQVPYENSFKSAKYELEENYFLFMSCFEDTLSILNENPSFCLNSQ